MLWVDEYLEDADFDNNHKGIERLAKLVSRASTCEPMQMTFRKKLRTLRKALRAFDQRAALMVFVLRHFRKPPAEVFRGAWRIIDGATSKRLIKDRHGVPPKHVRHFWLRHAIKLVFPQYVPTIVCNHEMLELMRRTPSVVASIHARTEFAMCAALDRAGLQSAIITAFPVKPAEIQNYNFSTPPQNILRKRDVFVQALSALRSGKVVVCDADFIVDKDLPSARVCISTSVFKFARNVKASLFFGYTQISDDGDMNCIFKPAPLSSASPEEDAQQFIAFLADVQSQVSDLTIGDWTRAAANQVI